jgi:hypothetical protein
MGVASSHPRAMHHSKYHHGDRHVLPGVPQMAYVEFQSTIDTT